jgi:hypothetical protein
MRSYNYRTLKELGINPLTGEACSFGQRILCDLSAKGVELMAEYLGIKQDAFFPNWNSRVGEDDAVASIMLDRDAFYSICKFAARLDGWQFLICNDVERSVYGTDDEEHTEMLYAELVESKDIHIIRNYTNHPRVKSRNVHQMTGRAA